MATNVSAGLFRPEVWSKELLRKIMDYGVMLDCVNRNYEGEIKRQGDTVHIQTVGNITISTYSADIPIVYQKLDGETTALKVDQAKNFGFIVDDIDKVQANITLMDKYTSQAKKEVVNVKDAYLHALGIAGVDSKNQMGAQALTATNVYSTLVDLYTLLSDSNAIDANGKGEDGKSPFLILPPQVVALIKKSEEAKNATTLGDQTIRRGSIMHYAGFDIKQSTNVKADSDGGAFPILAGTTEAITYAEQITKIESVKDKDNFGDYVRGLYVYGAKVAQPTCLASATVTIS